ncbi:MAG: hypothetical protein HC802_03375 [Caldilineaceae bacterium]|nr:hypothetical protein [Caldilineaceae bacterium]
MSGRLRILGYILAALGVVVIAFGIYGNGKVQNAKNALQAFSNAQNVQLSYNSAGELTDRGTTEGADNILQLLTGDWGYTVESGLDSTDPLVDTRDEYMFQMATIGYHILHGSQNVTLNQDVEYNGDGEEGMAENAIVYTPETWPEDADQIIAIITNGEDAVFSAGTYAVPVHGRYWTGFNRTHPLDGPARELAWSGTAHGLFGELGVGVNTAAIAEFAQFFVWFILAFGLGVTAMGGSLVWVTYGDKALASQASGSVYVSATYGGKPTRRTCIRLGTYL